MKLISDYSVAVYSATECKLYSASDAANLADLPSHLTPYRPDPQQLESIQQSIKIDPAIHSSRLIILVPDAWLSESIHKIDHLIPRSLQPLAALSYAVETTFSSPDALLFNYQYEVLSTQQSQLTVQACTSEWAERLNLPFLSTNKTSLLMSYGQWEAIQSRKLSWSACAKYALTEYKPEKAKRLKARRLCWLLIVSSLLVNGVASSYYFSINQKSRQAVADRQTIKATQSSWSSTDHSNDFSSSVLSLIQALPNSARLGHFESEEQRALLQITLPKQDLKLLLVEWREHNPDWRWEVEQHPHNIDSPLIQQQEVVDVSIKVFEG